MVEFLAVEDDVTGAGWQDAGDTTGKSGFSAAGFADDAQIAALFHREADGTNGLDERQAIFLDPSVTGGDVLDDQERLCFVRSFAGKLRFLRFECREQLLRVGVRGRRQDGLCRALFLHLAALEDDDAVGDLGNDGKVVRDIDAGDAAGLHDRLERLQHVDLGRDIERSGRFVEDHELGAADQRHSGGKPLQLSAGNLMRITFADGFRRGERQRLEEFDGALMRLVWCHQAVDAGHFDDLIHDGLRGVEGGGGTLRHIGDLGAAHLGPFALGKRRHVLAIDQQRALGNAAAGAGISHQRQRNRRLA